MEQEITNLESSLVGVAGEYLVAGELSLRGLIASVTLRNSRGVDIIVSNADASKSITIQVKTNKNAARRWMLSQKSESFYSDSHFYAFVSLRPHGERPAFHIVPSEVVANQIYNSHRDWLSGMKRNGEPRQDSSMRIFDETEGKFLEAWHLLGL